MNEYVPLASLKTTEGVDDARLAPLYVTDQLVPEGNPVSVNVTLYDGTPVFVAVKVIDWPVGAPLTMTDPEDGDAV